MLRFEKLPLWKGLRRKLEPPEKFLFELGLDAHGFIRQTTPKSIQDEVIRSYSRQEYTYITAPPGASPWGTRLGKDYLDYIRSRVKLRGKRVLEIGGGGTFMAETLTAEDGAEHFDLMDPSVHASPTSKNIRVLPEYFSAKSVGENVYDTIISLNCLEHVEDPVSFITDLRTILIRTDCEAVLAFPDIENQFANGDLNAFLHEHLSYFSKGSAQALLENCGLEVIDAYTKQDCLYFHLKPGPYNTSTRPLDLSLIETNKMVSRQLAWATDEFRRLTAAKKKVAFHGASNGLNNFLALSGLENDSNVQVFDGDETKRGLFLPTCRRAIYHSLDEAYRNIDHVFVSAMTFYPEIKDFLMQRIGLDHDKISPLFDLHNIKASKV